MAYLTNMYVSILRKFLRSENSEKMASSPLKRQLNFMEDCIANKKMCTEMIEEFSYQGVSSPSRKRTLTENVDSSVSPSKMAKPCINDAPGRARKRLACDAGVENDFTTTKITKLEAVGKFP